MALPRFPSLSEIAADPNLLLDVPTNYALEILEQMKRVAASVSDERSVGATPLDLALSLPRNSWMDSRHIRALSDEAAEIVINGGAIIVCMPPQHAKSTTLSVWTAFWALARKPETKILLISYEAKVARRWGVRVRNLIQLYGAPFGLFLDPKKMAGDDWELTTGGSMVCVGVGGPIAGRTVDLLLVDDAVKDQEAARSENQRETLWQWWDETVTQRILQETAVIVIGTRWHEDDLIGRLLKLSASGDGIQFTTVIFTAKALEGDLLGRSPGEGLWLEKNSQAFYDDKERTISPYAWSSSWQQSPTPPGGNTVDPEWWRFYRPSELPTLDAQKKSDSYHAGLVLSRLGAFIYLRDAYHEHSKIAASQHKSEKTVVSTIRGWHQTYPGARQKLVERSLAGPYLVQTLHHEISGLIVWPPKGQQKGSKEACLEACVPDIRSGNILLPLLQDGTRPRWVTEFIAELQQFPNAPHDDYVDAFSQGMAFLLPAVRRFVNTVQACAGQPQPGATPEQTHVATLHALISKLSERKLKVMKRQEKLADKSVIQFPISTGLLGGRRSSRSSLFRKRSRMC